MKSKSVKLYTTLPFLMLLEAVTLPVANTVQDPYSGVMTGSPNQLANSQGEHHPMLWANRCTDGCNGSSPYNSYNPPIIGSNPGFRFTDAFSADACTIAQLYRAQGLETEAENEAIMGGLAIIRDGDDPAAYLAAHGNTFLNVCDLQGEIFPPTETGVVLDYEVNDNRSTDRLEMLSGAYAAIAHSYGWLATLYTNRLTGTASNAINSSDGPFLAKEFDRITIVYDAQATPANEIPTDLDAQAAILGYPYNKIIVSVPMANVSCLAFDYVRQYIVNHGVLGAEGWADGADKSVFDTSAYFVSARQLMWGC